MVSWPKCFVTIWRQRLRVSRLNPQLLGDAAYLLEVLAEQGGDDCTDPFVVTSGTVESDIHEFDRHAASAGDRMQLIARRLRPLAGLEQLQLLGRERRALHKLRTRQASVGAGRAYPTRDELSVEQRHRKWVLPSASDSAALNDATKKTSQNPTAPEHKTDHAQPAICPSSNQP